MLTDSAYSENPLANATSSLLLVPSCATSAMANVQEDSECIEASSPQQLCFDWKDPTENREVESKNAIKIRTLQRFPISPPPQRQTRGGEIWEASTKQLGKSSSCTQNRPCADTEPRTDPQESRSAEELQTQSVPIDNSLRTGGPVRIGATMLRLLKSYGITDSEIAQGIASYSQKHCQASAS